MTLKMTTIRGTYPSVTGADVGDIVVFLSSDPRNRCLPRHVKCNHPYRIDAIDERGWTRFRKRPLQYCMAGCEPRQVGHYTIVARNVHPLVKVQMVL